MSTSFWHLNIFDHHPADCFGRKEHQDHKAGTKKKAGHHFGAGSGIHEQEERPYSQIEDERRPKKGVVFKDSIPPELSMIEGAAPHTPRGLSLKRHPGFASLERRPHQEIESGRSSYEGGERDYVAKEAQTRNVRAEGSPERMHGPQFQYDSAQVSGGEEVAAGAQAGGSPEIEENGDAEPAHEARKRGMDVSIDVPDTLGDEAVQQNGDADAREVSTRALKSTPKALVELNLCC